MRKPLLEFTDKGIYCAQADVYLDPWRPVEKALITHGHADHARWGHQLYITQNTNIPILKQRLGEQKFEGKEWGEPFTQNGVTFSFHPAGHIIGSAQIRVEYRGEVWVFTGDYKTEDDGISKPFEPVRCHVLITECTFGLPVFRWRPQSEIFEEINQWWLSNQAEGKTSILFGYSLGKAQRLLRYLNPQIGRIFTHGAVENMTEAIRPLVPLPPTTRITRETTKEELSGSIVLAPPSAQGGTWIKKMTPYVTGSASGWMAFRGARRRSAIDKGFVLSDHCDWSGLLSAIEATGAEKIIATHGYADLFARYLRENGWEARTAQTQFEDNEMNQEKEEA